MGKVDVHDAYRFISIGEDLMQKLRMNGLADMSGLDNNPRLNPTALCEKRKRFLPHYSQHDRNPRNGSAMSCQIILDDSRVGQSPPLSGRERLVRRHWSIQNYRFEKHSTCQRYDASSRLD